MAELILMPKQGNTVETCVLNRWHIVVGDTVEVGTPLCEIETDKSTMDVESTASGTVLHVFYHEGDDVPVQEPIVIVGQEHEDVSNLLSVAHDTAPPIEPQLKGELSPRPSHPPELPSESSRAHTSDRVAISPRAKNLALRHQYDYTHLTGSGPHGLIVERDLRDMVSRAYSYGSRGGRAEAENTLAPPPAFAHAPISNELSLAMQETPVSAVRKITARRMMQSLSSTAQLTLHTTADAEKMCALRTHIKQSINSVAHSDIENVSINDMILFIVARCLQKFPLINSHYREGALTQFTTVNIGCAVDTEQGLYVPVIRRAHTRSLREIASAMSALAEKCRDGTISADDMADGTFTVSNLGSLGIEYFTPVLNTPQTAILGVGSLVLTPTRNEEGAIVHRQHLGLSLTFDHQAYDGAYAAKFLRTLSEHIANFELVYLL